jgi:hypothetical protein
VMNKVGDAPRPLAGWRGARLGAGGDRRSALLWILGLAAGAARVLSRGSMYASLRPDFASPGQMMQPISSVVTSRHAHHARRGFAACEAAMSTPTTAATST